MTTISVPYLDRTDARMFYARREGHAPTLCFVHGFGCSHRIWEQQMAALAGRHDVVACDLRGHGQSKGEGDEYSIEVLGRDVAALLQEVCPQRTAVLIGHSLGCRVVLQAYLEAPRSVAGLILLDGSWTSPAEFPRASKAVEEQMNNQGYKAFVQHEVEQMFIGRRDADLQQQIVVGALSLPELVGRSLFLRTMAWDAFKMERALAQIAVPLVIAQSTGVSADRTTRTMLTADGSTPWLDLVRRTVPTADIRIIAGVGHFSMLEAADRVNGLIEGSARPRSSSR